MMTERERLHDDDDDNNDDDSELMNEMMGLMPHDIYDVPFHTHSCVVDHSLVG